MDKLFFKSDYIFNRRDKSLWKGILLNFIVTILAVALIIFMIGFNYQHNFVEPFANQILKFPEFTISKSGLAVNGENFKEEVNGVMIVVNDDLELDDLVYEYAKNEYKKVVILAKDGIANIWNEKLIQYDKFAESSFDDDYVVTDSQVKMMVLDSALVLNNYYKVTPIMSLVFSIMIFISIYVMYLIIFILVNKILKYNIKFKNLVNIISYSYIVPLIAFGGIIFWGIENPIVLAIIELIAIFYYSQVLLYFKKKGGNNNA